MLLGFALLISARGVASPIVEGPVELTRWDQRQWGLKSGLPQSSVTAIAPSLDGRLWVSTFAGLARFDGVGFEQLKLTNIDLPIRITDLTTDPTQPEQMWISTEGEGLWRLTDARLSDQVKVERAELPPALNGATIFDLHAQGAGPRAGLWLASDQGAYHKPPQGDWVQVMKTPERSSSFELLVDDEGTVWSCSDRYLSKLKAGSTLVEPLLPPPFSVDTPRMERPACRGGVAYQGHYFGLFERSLWLISPDGAWSEVKVQTAHGGPAQSLGGEWRQRPWLSPQGVLWLLSGTDLLSFGPIGDVLRVVKAGRPLSAERHALDHAGRVMYSLNEGGVWIGTTGGGLHRLSSLGFSQILWPGASEQSQMGPITQTQQELWFVKSYQSLWRSYSLEGVRHYEAVSLPTPNKSGMIDAVGGRLNGDVMISREGELLTFQRAEGAFRSRSVERALSGSGKVSLITPLRFKAPTTSEDAWWIGTHSGAIFSTTEEGELERLSLPSDLIVGKVLSLIELRPRGGGRAKPSNADQVDLAVGHARGVSLRRDGLWRSYSSETGLPRGDIRALLEDPRGVVWVASYGGGLGWIDPSGGVGTLDVYDAHLSALELTKDQSLWIQGNKGLTRVKLSDLERRRREPSWPLVTELLQVGEANGWVRGSAVLREDGALWLAGVDGLSITQTAQLMSSNPLPSPQLRAAHLGDYPLSIAPQEPQTALHFQEVPTESFRRLEVHYHTSTLDHSRSIGYEHRLLREGEGEELPWVPAGSSQLLTYTNLKPGKYRLQLRSVSLEYAPSELTELGVLIPAKWHERLWIRLLLGLALILIPTLISQWRARLISLHNRLLREEIEQRVAAEERLRDREARYRQVFNEAANAFLLYTREGECLEVNQQATALFDCSAEELMRLTPRALGLPPLDRWISADESSQTPLLCARVDGSVFPARMSYVPCVVEGFQMWLVSVMDLSAIVSAHEQQTWVLHQRSVARRMDALGRLSSGIAHDLNNILGALSGNIELIKDELPQDEWLEESIEDIIECLRRGATLSQQLLAFSRLKTTQTRAQLNPVELVKRLEKLLHRLMPQGVNLVLELNETDDFKLDQGLFEQVLLTLVLHAAESSSVGGEVLIRLRQSHGRSLQLSVEDQGPAIPLHTLSALIESSTEQAPQQSPALVLVHRWVSQAGGALTVTRRESSNQALVEWSSIDTTPVPRSQVAQRAELGSVCYRIAVVDDNQELRRVLVRQLTSLGHEVTSYGDPLEALEELSAREMPDVLISDVIMPGLNGRQLTSELRAVFPELKVIFISGYTSDVLGDINTQKDRELLLHKPFTKEVLRRKIEELIG